MSSENRLIIQRGEHLLSKKDFTDNAIKNFFDNLEKAHRKHELREDLRFVGCDEAAAELDDPQSSERLEELYSIYGAGMDFATFEGLMYQTKLYLDAHGYEGDPFVLLDIMAEAEEKEPAELLAIIIAHYAVANHPELLETA